MNLKDVKKDVEEYVLCVVGNHIASRVGKYMNEKYPNFCEDDYSISSDIDEYIFFIKIEGRVNEETGEKRTIEIAIEIDEDLVFHFFDEPFQLGEFSILMECIKDQIDDEIED